MVGFVPLIGFVVLIVRQSRNRPEEGVINVSGNAEVTEVNAGFKFAGKIEKLFTDEGMKINKGDKMAVLDSAELEHQLLQSKDFLSEAGIRLTELRTGTRPQEIAQARAQLKSAEAELTKAKKDYERADRLYKNVAISTQQMELERKVYDVALSQQKTAAEALSLAKEGPRTEEIKASESRVRQAESAVSIAEERMKDAVLVAPLTGVILRKNVEAGEVVSVACLGSGSRQVRLCERRKPDGAVAWEEVHASPIRGPDGALVQVVEVWRDITERRVAEARLAEGHRLATLGQLASGFSHEMNTPLGTVLACVETGDLATASGVLAESGLQVRGASGWSESLALLRELRPAAELLDSSFLEGAGPQLCAALRRMSGRVETPVLALCRGRREVGRALESGASDVVDKPLDWAVVGRRLDVLVRAHLASSELERNRRQVGEAHRLVAEALNRFERQGRTDPLTGLPTRLHFQGVLERARQAGGRSGTA